MATRGDLMNTPYREVHPEIEGDAERFLAGVAPIKPGILQFRFWKIPLIFLIIGLGFYFIWKGWIS